MLWGDIYMPSPALPPPLPACRIPDYKPKLVKIVISNPETVAS